MSLECAVCGSGRVTQTLETDSGLKAFCDRCFAPVAEATGVLAGKEHRRVASGLAALGRLRIRSDEE